MKSVSTKMLILGLLVVLPLLAEDVGLAQSTQKVNAQYPNIWVRLPPESKARILSLFRLKPNSNLDELKSEVFIEIEQPVSDGRKIKYEQIVVGFFDGKSYGPYQKFLKKIFEAGEKIEEDFHIASSLDGMELEDGARIVSLGYSRGRIDQCTPLVNGAIEKLDRNNNRVWAKFVAVKINAPMDENCDSTGSIDNFVYGIVDLHDGTLLLHGYNFAVRLNVSDGRLSNRNKSVKVLDYENVEKYVEELIRIEEPKINQKIVHKYFD